MQKTQFQQYDIVILNLQKCAENANVTWLKSEEIIKIFKQRLIKTRKLQNNYTTVFERK